VLSTTTTAPAYANVALASATVAADAAAAAAAVACCFKALSKAALHDACASPSFETSKTYRPVDVSSKYCDDSIFKASRKQEDACALRYNEKTPRASNEKRKRRSLAFVSIFAISSLPCQLSIRRTCSPQQSRLPPAFA